MLYIINTLYNLIILKITCNKEAHCIGQPYDFPGPADMLAGTLLRI